MFGIFNVKRLKDNLDYKNFYEKLESENKIEDISGKDPKSFILTSDENLNVKGFISNIGTIAIRKRQIV